MAASKTYSKLGISRNASDEVKSIVSKLVRDPSGSTTAGKRPTEGKINLSRDMFDKLSRDTGQNTIDADSVFQLLPDVELAEQILVGSIISPKDMSTVELDFTVDQKIFDTELARPLVNVVEEYFKNDYKIDDMLDGMLEEILFTRGAYILAVLPESHLDRIINTNSSRISTESYGQVIQRIERGLPMGFLGHPRDPRVSMESFRDKEDSSSKITGPIGKHTYTIPNITVSDNFSHLKIPRVRELQRAVRINSLLRRHNVSMEASAKGLKPEQIEKLYQDPLGKGVEQTVMVTPTLYSKTPSVGHPLVMKLPIESTIPVYVPGEPEEHIGYFIMVENGRPVVREENKDYYGEIRSNFRANTQDNTSEMVRQVKEAMGATNRTDLDVDQLQEAYTALVENDLINRLEHGIYGEKFELGCSDEIYRIMLYRTLKARQTQLIYIPVEFVTYMAFNYNNHGIGETLLTKSKILSSMRSVLLFAETMSGVRNAIGRKRANITIDAHDPDPQKTISDVQQAILESAHRGFPLGSPDPAQTLDYLNRAGFDFSINIDSEDYPTTRVEFDDYNSQVNAGNQELQERLRRMHIASWGLSPDWVDPQQTPEFAVSVVNNNLIMTRRVLRYQKKFTNFLSDFIQSFARHSSILRSHIKDAMKGQKAKLAPDLRGMDEEEVIDTFIDAIRVSLPAPDSTKVEVQLQSFEQYAQLLERALEAYITEDLFPAELLAREPDMINQVITTISAYYKRSWLEHNNVMPELNKLTELDGRKPHFSLLDVQKAHFKSLGEAINRYIEGVEKIRGKWEDKYGEEEEDGFGDGDDASEDDDIGSDDDLGGGDDDTTGDDDPFGGDDLDGGDDADSDDAEEDGEEDVPEADDAEEDPEEEDADSDTEEEDQ